MTFRPPAAPDPWTDRLAGLAAIRGFIGESTIKESSTIGIVTRVTMPLLQAISVAGSFVVFCAGGWVLVDGLVRAFGINLNPGMYLLALVTFGAIVGGLYGLLANVFEGAQREVAWAFAVTGAFVIISALLSAAFAFREVFDIWRFLEILLGCGSMIGSALLFFHQVLNIADPYWRTSPAERELLAMWRQGPQPQGSRSAKRIPYRHSGRQDRILTESPEIDDVYPDDVEFEVLDFLEMARTIGIGRNHWLGEIERRLPSTGVVVGRTKYDEILDRLVEDGYVIRGGSGKAARWARNMDPLTAYERECQAFEDAWGFVLGLETVEDGRNDEEDE